MLIKLRKLLRPRKALSGQGILEYAMLLGVVIAAIVAIQILVLRSVKGRFEQSAGQIGEEFTTAETYAVEERSQSARKEQTIANLTNLSTEWTKSTIQDTSAWIPDAKSGRKLDYPGYELSSTDYVTAIAGGGELGTHSFFDSGKISTKRLFEDER